jgi:hypothetical protein
MDGSHADASVILRESLKSDDLKYVGDPIAEYVSL